MRGVPSAVSIREVGPRDGLQNEDPEPTDAKVRLLDALSQTGVRRIEAVSFVHPKAIPQMADADEVWKAAAKNPDARYTEIEVVVSASDTHNRRNLNRSTAESLDDIAALIDALHSAGATAEVVVATSFGCPDEGDVDPALVASFMYRVVADGAGRVAFCFTIVMGPP